MIALPWPKLGPSLALRPRAEPHQVSLCNWVAVLCKGARVTQLLNLHSDRAFQELVSCVLVYMPVVGISALLCGANTLLYMAVSFVHTNVVKPAVNTLALPSNCCCRGIIATVLVT